MLYRLENKIPILENDVSEWLKWFGKINRVVFKTEDIRTNITVSTVFLGINHSWDKGPPILFETMVFGGENDGDMNRYATQDEAEIGHLNMVYQIMGTKQIGEQK